MPTSFLVFLSKPKPVLWICIMALSCHVVVGDISIIYCNFMLHLSQFQALELPDTYSLELRALVQEMMSQDPEDRPTAKDIVHNDMLTYHRVSIVMELQLF